MKRSTVLRTVAIVGILLVSVATLAKQVKTQPFDSQAGFTFVNAEGEQAHGLVVVLSVPGEVRKNDDGSAGPFRNVSGNGGTKITMTNPTALIEPDGDGIDMIFESYQSNLRVTKWWWTDAKGKPLGKKNKVAK